MKFFLQIYFQFGTFEEAASSFFIDLVINATGAFIGILGAYYVYLLSVKHLRKDRLKYFVSLLESVIPSAQRQGDYSIDHSDVITNNPYTLDRLKLEANRDFKRLADKLDQEGVHHAYLKKYKRTPQSYKKFQTIYSTIDYIDFLIDQLISSNEKTLIGIWERKKSYANEFRVLKEKLEMLTLDQNFKQANAAYCQYIVNALQNYYNNNPEGENLQHSHITLATPVREYIIKNGPVNTTNTELLLLLNNLQNIYLGIEMAATYAAKDYKDIGEELKKAANKLNIETEELRNNFKVKKNIRVFSFPSLGSLQE